MGSVVIRAPFTGLLAVPLERLEVRLASRLKPDFEKPRKRGSAMVARIGEPAVNGGPKPLRGKPRERG